MTKLLALATLQLRRCKRHHDLVIIVIKVRFWAAIGAAASLSELFLQTGLVLFSAALVDLGAAFCASISGQIGPNEQTNLIRTSVRRRSVQETWSSKHTWQTQTHGAGFETNECRSAKTSLEGLTRTPPRHRLLTLSTTCALSRPGEPRFATRRKQNTAGNN